MALFGRKVEQDEKPSVLQGQLLQQKLNELRDVIKERKKNTESLNGVVVYPGDKFDIKNEYMFLIEDDAYRFVPYYGHMHISDNELEQAAGREEICLRISDTRCSLLDGCDPTPEETDKNNGVLERKFGESKVRLQFTCVDGQEYIFTVNALREVSKFPDFFMGIGVKNFYNTIDLAPDSLPVEVYDGAGLLSNNQFVVMRQRNELVFARFDRRNNSVYIASLPVEDILFFKDEGSLHYEQQISGGGGGGVNYKGAVIGGLLFGGAGAIIGSQHGTEANEISSKTVSHDTRRIVLQILRQGNIFSISTSVDSEMAFNWFIPEKEYSYVIGKRRAYFESMQGDQIQ